MENLTGKLRIARLGQFGDGLTAEGQAVPGALPGELVELTDGGKLRVLEPSADRIRPPCSHAGSCGGCKLQHGSDNLIADWKLQTVRQALAAQGLSAELRGPITSPQKSRRRAGFSGRRTKKGALIGFHAARSDTVVETPNCLVITNRLRALMPLLREITQLAGSRKGELSFQATETRQGIDLAVTGGKELEDGLRAELASLLGRDGQVVRLSWGEELLFQAEPPQILFGSVPVPVNSGGFLQATLPGETALVQLVTEGLEGADHVVDLFSGAGTFTFPLAHTAELHAVEADAPAIKALDAGARQSQGLKRITTECRDLFRRPLDKSELKRFDAAVIDPPRAGALAQSQALAEARLPRLAMVSCNPASFARDVALLVAAGYELGPITVIDQFLWSPHVELATILRLA
ncbi:MAG: class I SAM-dependent RNA methyltransferase [Mangrovicoccus sp.]